MSQLNVDNIKNRLGAGQPDIVGVAKAFVNFDGTGTVAIRASYNVSSITDNGVGDYTVNFTNAMPDQNYAAVATGALGGTAPRLANITDLSASSFSISIQNVAAGRVDVNTIAAAIFR